MAVRRTRTLDQTAQNRYRFGTNSLIGFKKIEQLICVQLDTGCSNACGMLVKFIPAIIITGEGVAPRAVRYR